MKMRNIFAAALLVCRAAAASPPLPTFVTDYCIDCHDAETHKGNLDFAALEAKFDLDEWVKVYDRIQAGEMPPAKKPRPDPVAAQNFLATMVGPLADADLAREQRDGRARLRRLNRMELENTLRDLLALPGLRVKELLPEDGKAHGFDRLSDALDISFVHLQSYLAAVDKALNAALCPLPEKPATLTYRYRLWDNVLHDGRNCEGTIYSAVLIHTAIGLVGMRRDEKFVADRDHHISDEPPLSTAIGIFRHEDADYRTSLTQIGAFYTGWYKLRVRGYSFGWDGKQVIPTEKRGALGWGIYAKNEHFGTVDLPPNAAAEREITAWLERGSGMSAGVDDNLRIIAASCENAPGNLDKSIVGPPLPTPGVAVEWVEIEGPMNEQWPPPSYRALFGDLPVKTWSPDSGVPRPAQQVWPLGNPRTLPRDPYGVRGELRPVVYVESEAPTRDAELLLRRFLPRAFRRPATPDEVASYTAKVATQLKDGAAFQDAMIAVYREILVSPDFLFLREMPGALDDFALATRLSYFLWSTLPDETLESLADAHQLSQPAVLDAQVERMLHDPRAERFVENFLGQWLRLREIGATQPDKKLYPEFMPWLQEAMLLEAHATFKEMLERNLGITHLVQSDFAMLNEPLGRLYGIEGVRGWDIQKIALPPGSHRGGFLTMAAVLKTTANGTTTSPVKRGAFVMDRLLGIVPRPPPPNAGAVEPDVRGATTVREQLERHRNNPTCAGCHAKMDGYGFALESFDPVGEWRDRYRATGGGAEGKFVNGHAVGYHAGPLVDPSGLMPDGRPFADVDGLRALLVSQPEKLASAFTSHLITYATGAEISFADRAEVQRIVEAAKTRNYGLNTLLHEVVRSRLFLSK